jgi:hypothetical protein
MKIQFKVINLGLNEFGVKELNTYYKHNISNNLVKEFNINDIEGDKKRIFKQPISFLKLKEDNYIGFVDCKQQIPNSKYNGGYFSLQLKHINYEIIKIEVIENESNFKFD